MFPIAEKAIVVFIIYLNKISYSCSAEGIARLFKSFCVFLWGIALADRINWLSANSSSDSCRVEIGHCSVNFAKTKNVDLKLLHFSSLAVHRKCSISRRVEWCRPLILGPQSLSWLLILGSIGKKLKASLINLFPISTDAIWRKFKALCSKLNKGKFFWVRKLSRNVQSLLADSHNSVLRSGPNVF